MLVNIESYQNLTAKITEQFQELPQVQAIAMAGSQTTGNVDEISDIDLYVYITKDIPIEIRRDIINEIGASRAEINNQFWDTGDEWFEKETGIVVDIMYWSLNWIKGQISRTLERY
ncbi:MAG: nucleotidyltransferase domain-containing protein, partial [Calditrichia bacterium]|nr:nucleotidyltransferase domain-containing protein [Calditrichia bacterium]